MHGRLVGQLLVQTGEQELLGVLGGQAGDGLQLLQLAHADLLDLGKARLAQLGALAQIFFFLLQGRGLDVYKRQSGDGAARAERLYLADTGLLYRGAGRRRDG